MYRRLYRFLLAALAGLLVLPAATAASADDLARRDDDGADERVVVADDDDDDDSDSSDSDSDSDASADSVASASDSVSDDSTSVSRSDSSVDDTDSISDPNTDSNDSTSNSDTSVAGFSDVHGSYVHADGIRELAARRVTNGYPDGSFRPNASVIRGQMASFLARGYSLPAGDTDAFRDSAGGPHTAGISAVARAGVAEGYPDGTFRPGRQVTRGQLATFLARAMDIAPNGDVDRFTDTRGSVHAGAIGALADAGIINGFGDGSFRPNDPVSRGQMATLLSGALNQ